MTEERTQIKTGKRISRHTLIMLACCLLPLAVLAVLWLAGVKSEYLLFGAVLLCPLAHVFLMRAGHDGAHRRTAGKEE